MGARPWLPFCPENPTFSCVVQSNFQQNKLYCACFFRDFPPRAVLHPCFTWQLLAFRRPRHPARPPGGAARSNPPNPPAPASGPPPAPASATAAPPWPSHAAPRWDAEFVRSISEWTSHSGRPCWHTFGPRLGTQHQKPLTKHTPKEKHLILWDKPFSNPSFGCFPP